MRDDYLEIFGDLQERQRVGINRNEYGITDRNDDDEYNGEE